MPHNIDHFQNSKTDTQDELGGDFVQQFADFGLINFGDDFDPNALATSNARANRAAALKQLTIQRKKLEFQQKTGLRDISQAREKGLKGAINNALQRGIFRSGILTENKAEVSRESDEAASDLKTNIQFALDDLAARRQGLAAQRFGTPTQTGPPLTPGQAAALANEKATNLLNQPEAPVVQAPTFGGIDEQVSTGVVQVPRLGGPNVS